MNADLMRVSTVDMSRQDWLNRRRKTLGGSDAAGIVHLSKWSTPYTVWADKTGRLPDKEDTEAMRIGRDLEEYVARRFAESTGKKVRRLNAMLYNPAYPFAHADIDRAVVGEDAGLECKTTSDQNLKKFANTDFPEQYYAQCVHYLAVTGAERWYLAVLVFGRGFFVYTLERDETEIAALMTAEAAFMRQYVRTDSPPPVDGEPATGEAIQTIFAKSCNECVTLFGAEHMLDEYTRLKDLRTSIDKQLSEIENQIKQRMDTASTGTCGDYSVSWKTQTRTLLDTAKLRAEHPEIDFTKYSKTSESRPFRVTQIESKEKEI